MFYFQASPFCFEVNCNWIGAIYTLSYGEISPEIWILPLVFHFIQIIPSCLALVQVCAAVLLLSLAREGTLAVGSVHTVWLDAALMCSDTVRSLVQGRMPARVVPIYKVCVSWLLNVDCYSQGVIETEFAEAKFCRAVSLLSRPTISFSSWASRLPWRRLAHVVSLWQQCKLHVTGSCDTASEIIWVPKPAMALNHLLCAVYVYFLKWKWEGYFFLFFLILSSTWCYFLHMKSAI